MKGLFVKDFKLLTSGGNYFIPSNNKAKPYQIKQVRELIKKYKLEV